MDCRPLPPFCPASFNVRPSYGGSLFKSKIAFLLTSALGRSRPTAIRRDGWKAEHQMLWTTRNDVPAAHETTITARITKRLVATRGSQYASDGAVWAHRRSGQWTILSDLQTRAAWKHMLATLFVAYFAMPIVFAGLVCLVLPASFLLNARTPKTRFLAGRQSSPRAACGVLVFPNHPQSILACWPARSMGALARTSLVVRCAQGSNVRKWSKADGPQMVASAHADRLLRPSGPRCVWRKGY